MIFAVAIPSAVLRTMTVVLGGSWLAERVREHAFQCFGASGSAGELAFSGCAE